MALHADPQPKSDHPERPERVTWAYDELRGRGLAARCVDVAAREATHDELALVHDALGYVKPQLALAAECAEVTREHAAALAAASAAAEAAAAAAAAAAAPLDVPSSSSSPAEARLSRLAANASHADEPSGSTSSSSSQR